METIDQQVLNDNKEIYSHIQSELHKATSEILLATAWFTDEDLFNILLVKLTQGVHIEIIIADNQENEKLYFNLLVAKGAAVYKIKNSGYGIMNQKFCVIDRRIALHGSYNWTINAKKNNHESIISTNHQETINSLIENFNSIKNNIQDQKGEPIHKNGTPVSHSEKLKGAIIEKQTSADVEFREVLDSMIAAEVGNFDRDKLREYGFDRGSKNNGDHQVLYKAFDSLYSVYINDVDVVEDKKRRLIAKVEEYRVKAQDGLAKEFELQIDFLEKEHNLQHSSLEAKKTNLDTEIAVASKSIEDIRDVKIPFIENQNAELDQQIKKLERECIIPKIKWLELITTLICTTVLLTYLFLFYSSAAYILLFSVEDAKAAASKNIPMTTAQIFDPNAVTKAMTKSGTAPLFIFLFVIIPLTATIIDRLVPRKFAYISAILGFIFGIIILDFAIAYKVTQAVYEVNYYTGIVNIPWEPQMAFKDPNFYLVFILGALGLLLFKLTFKKILQFFEDRNPDLITQQNQLLIKQLKQEIKTNTEKILSLKEQIISLEKNIIQIKADIKQIDFELADLSKSFNEIKQKKRTQQLKQAETIDKIAAIYSMRIQSDNLRVSVDALKDRINIFLEGWNDFLCTEFSREKAARKTAQAAEVATKWQAEKITTQKVDNREKINQDA